MKIKVKDLKKVIKEETSKYNSDDNGRKQNLYSNKNAKALLTHLDETNQYINMQTLIDEEETVMQDFLNALDNLYEELSNRIVKYP